MFYNIKIINIVCFVLKTTARAGDRHEPRDGTGADGPENKKGRETNYNKTK